MTAYVRLTTLGLLRAPARTASRTVVLAAAVALLGAMLLFLGNSLQTMTSSAVRSVPLDWQGPVPSYAIARRVASGVEGQPGVLHASATATAPFSGAEHRSGAGVIHSASGSILAVPPSYSAHFGVLRLLHGSFRGGQVVLDQQLAATLQARVGDRISISPRPAANPASFQVSGVAVVTAPDVLFQPLNPLLGPAPAQPPANVIVMPLGTFVRKIAPALPAITPATAAGAAIPGAQSGVQWQVQAQVDRHVLDGSPRHALRKATQVRNRVERSLPGQVQFVDNLEQSLTTASADALYAQALYVMLAVPGALVALGLSYLAALGAADRDRRELALLRSRGASRRELLAMAYLESALIGLPAGLLGATMALLATWQLVGGSGLTPARALVATGACAVLAVAGALAARIGTGLAVFSGSVSEQRRSARRTGTPLWQRLYLDWISLGVAGLVYWLTARTGFSAVVNPDSNPTLSLSVYMFLGPALLWLGATLLLVRLRGRAVGWIARRVAGDRATTLGGFLLASAARRAGQINRGLVVVGLLLAFGVELGLFAATYDRQAHIDAELTLGADVVVTASPGATRQRSLERQIAAVPGVAATSALDHSYAYVGPDLQDTFGIDPKSFSGTTSLRNSYFLGGSATEIMHRLVARPDAILVSRETVTDYALQTGDLLKLRVLDRRKGSFRVVPFHVAGIVQEFPSAPRDSFMVANRSYLLRATHDTPNVIFVKASGDPVQLSKRIGREVVTGGAAVKNIREQTAQTVSSITTVSLSGMARIEEAFAIALAAAAMGLFLAVGLAERRHELATMAAIGAPLREAAAFLWSEAALVLGAGLALAGVLGWLLAEMLVAMLRHVFDPPPDHLTVPWGFLGGLAAAAVLGSVVAALLAGRALSRLPLGAILREE